MIRNKLLKAAVFLIPAMIIIGMLQESYAGIKDAETHLDGIVISEVMAKNLSGLQDIDGDYSDWIEIYNASDEEINLEGYGLSDSAKNPFRWTFPAVTLKGKESLVIWASGKDMAVAGEELHTNFRLDSTRETVVLSSPQGECLDQLNYADMEWDISYGRSGLDYNAVGYLAYATPGDYNAMSFLTGGTMHLADWDEVIFSRKSGFYEEGFELELYCEDEDAVIVYTTDGSEPDMNSNIYTKPIVIEDVTERPNQWVTVPCLDTENYNSVEYGINNVDKCNVIRARSYKDGCLSEKVTTGSYFIDKDYTLPVVSLTANPEDLFNSKDGMYVMGDIYWLGADSQLPFHNFCASVYYGKKSGGAIEIFDSSGELQFQDDMSLSLSGTLSRTNNLKKALNVECQTHTYVDEKSKINTDVLNLKSTGGGSTFPLLYQNRLLSDWANELNIGPTGGNFVLLFIDGEYWGIYYIRDKLNAQYICREYDIDETNLYAVSSAIENVRYVWDAEAGASDALTAIDVFYEEVRPAFLPFLFRIAS